MPEPAKGRYPFLNCNVWEDALGIMQVDEDEDEEEEELQEAESQGEPLAPPDGGAIVLDNLSIDS